MMSALNWFPAETFVVDAVDERLLVYHFNTEIYLAFATISILLHDYLASWFKIIK